MRRSGSRKRSAHAHSGEPARDAIDALYGLDPVFEPGHEPGQTRGTTVAFYGIQCPYCGERFDTPVDASNGAATYIEDCHICCQPIEVELQVDSQGVLVGLSARRS